MKAYIWLILLILGSCVYQAPNDDILIDNRNVSLILDVKQANRLASLPLKCLEQEYPNKLGQVLDNESELLGPKALHPAFYGCFDWHSSVHGHWMLVRLLKEFPKMDQDKIKSRLSKTLTKENIAEEIAYFDMKQNASFERTYGWAWLLKLQMELNTSQDTMLQTWGESLQPLSDRLVKEFEKFLPKLTYPLRSGEHVNTAFALTIAYDYAESEKLNAFKKLIVKRAKFFYGEDQDANMAYEPSGFDFLSPNLEEVHLMSKILNKQEFSSWLLDFMPKLYDKNFRLVPADVSDRTDGKLVHLDGLNLSRAWCLYAIAQKDRKLSHLRFVADKHLQKSLPSIVDGNYSGEHWLASFALYALLERKKD
jgi:Protein of unknown function (DUF2891)